MIKLAVLMLLCDLQGDPGEPGQNVSFKQSECLFLKWEHSRVSRPVLRHRTFIVFFFQTGFARDAGCEGRQGRGRQRCKRSVENLIRKLFMSRTDCVAHVLYYCVQ